MTARPTIEAPAPFPLPAHTELTLNNNLRAALVPFGSIPSGHVRLVLRAGGLNESAGKSGLAVLASRFLKEGTEELDAAALAERIAGFGGRLATYADDDVTVIEAQLLSEFVPDFLEVLGQIARRPRLPAGELERLRAELLRELAVAGAEPETIALGRFQAALYGDHPYARVLPRTADVEALSIEDVRAFIDNELCAGRAYLQVAGRFDASATETALRTAFEGWTAGPAPLVAPPSPASSRAIHLADRPGAEQSTIRMGLPVPSPSHHDYLPLSVTDTLLGGAFMSRITTNLREDKGYTYSPRSTIAARYRDAYWMQAADVTTADTGASLHEIFSEIEWLATEPPSAEELEGVQKYMAGSFLMRNATPAGLLTQLAFLDFHELGGRYAEEYIDRVFAVTPEEVRRLVAEHLRPEAITIAIAGDADRIRKQIEPYGRVVD